MKILTIPGLGGSPPGHWQSHWENNYHSVARVWQRDWNQPVCKDWTANLEQAVSNSGPETILVAHSLGCLTVVFWAICASLSVRGALLVAPPNTESPDCPEEVIGFKPVPKQKLPFNSILVASSNDPYSRVSFAQDCAEAWGSRFINAGPLGHINAESGIGEWAEGYSLLEKLAKA